jgi:hypothetical protein
MTLQDADPKGLIRESYAIDGITLGECRSIFVDWALSLPAGFDMPAAIRLLMAHYARPDHPMTQTLAEGLTPAAPPKRRGGRAGRVG